MTVAAEDRRTARDGGDHLVDRATRAMTGTPGRLGLAQIASVLACLAIGIAGFVAGTGQANDLDSAHDDAADLVDTQDLRNHLVSADAAATSAFLVGGLEPPATRESYTRDLGEAARAVPSLAARAPERADHLAAISDAIQRYAGLVESARANNRQGFPVGTGYLDLASATLREDVLPVLDDVTERLTDRMGGHLTTVSMRQNTLVVVLAGLLALVLVQWWLAHRTHRMISPWLVSATVLALIGSICISVGVIGGNAVARDVAGGSYAATVATSAALAEATDAKSQESFTLIKRGSGQEHEDRFRESTAVAGRLLVASDKAADAQRPTSDLLATWLERHDRIRELDDSGRWDDAVSAAISLGDDSATTAFEDFSDQARQDIERTGEHAGSRLVGASQVARATGWIALLAGLLAAGMTTTGIWARQKEYL